MTKNPKIQKNNGGYAILFAVVLISILSMITIGLTNSTYKHILFASLASDSQTAFYQADTAAECALYASTFNLDTIGTPTAPFACAKHTDTASPFPSGYYLFEKIKTSIDDNKFKYEFNLLAGWSSKDPCFNFDIIKGSSTTEIFARGYSSCDLSNPRTVERGISVSY